MKARFALYRHVPFVFEGTEYPGCGEKAIWIKASLVDGDVIAHTDVVYLIGDKPQPLDNPHCGSCGVLIRTIDNRVVGLQRTDIVETFDVAAE